MEKEKPKTQKCKQCKKEFEVNPKWRFKRKYCETCSKERKEHYENLHTISIEDCDDE